MQKINDFMKKAFHIGSMACRNIADFFVKARLCTVAFLAVITLCGFFNLLNTNKPTMSQLENRELQKIPEFSLAALFNGSYTRDFENYYSDTFLFRENLVLASHDIKAALSLAGEDDALLAYAEGADAAQQEAAKEDEAMLADNTAGNTAGLEQETSDTSSEAAASSVDQPASTNASTDLSAEPAATAAASTGSTELGSSSLSQDSSNDPGTAPAVEKKPQDSFKDLGFSLSVDGTMKRIMRFGKDKLKDYARILNLYGEKMGKDVTVYSLIPPETGQYLAMKKYSSVESQNGMADYLNSMFESNVKAVDVYGAINRHKNEYVYFRSDHHWTMRGAYYGYAALMDAKGITPVPLEKYQIKKVEGSLGSIYRNTLSSSLKKNPDTVELLMPFVNHEFYIHNGKYTKKADVLDMKYVTWQDKYPIFLSTGGGDWSIIKTDVKNGRKALVIKTSFGNPFSPLLMPDYEEVYTVDARFYRKGSVGKNIVQFVKDNGIQDVIFVIYEGDVYGNIIMPAAEKLLN